MDAHTPTTEPGRLLGSRLSTAVVLFHSAVAERMGLNVTDWKCANVVNQWGPLHAGELAEHTGMSTAATAQTLGRLEKAGMVCRERDTEDGRRVLVRAVHSPEKGRELALLFSVLNEGMSGVVGRYDPDQLMLIADFLTDTCDVLEDSARRLRAEADGRKQ